jgi:hypothetical protein
VTWSCISEDDEAQYEFKAVEYATKCAGHAAPTANIGMGSGSVQLVAYDAKNRYGACMPHSATACPCPISRRSVDKQGEQVASNPSFHAQPDTRAFVFSRVCPVS